MSDTTSDETRALKSILRAAVEALGLEFDDALHLSASAAREDELDAAVFKVRIPLYALRDLKRKAADERTAANVAAFVLKAPALDRLLLVRSGKPGRAWELPGGVIEPGESRSGAAKRECWEETGVRLVRVAHYCSVEGCEVFRGASETDPLTAGDDAIEAHWFDRADIACLSLSDLPTAAVIRQWVERR